MAIVSSNTPQLQSVYHEPQIVKQGIFTCPEELLDLKIIDFQRVDSWNGSREALESIASWFIGRAAYTVLHYDLKQAPERSDWPDWEHSGDHEYYGRLFWNDFHWKHLGELIFSDRPDFFGTMTYPNLRREVQFWGDIGQVSAGAFSRTQKNMRAHDLWISVEGRHRQIVIEALTDISAAFHRRNEKMLLKTMRTLHKKEPVKKVPVPTLWD